MTPFMHSAVSERMVFMAGTSEALLEECLYTREIDMSSNYTYNVFSVPVRKMCTRCGYVRVAWDAQAQASEARHKASWLSSVLSGEGYCALTGVGRSGAFCAIDIVLRRLRHLQGSLKGRSVPNEWKEATATATAFKDLVIHLRKYVHW